MWPTLSPSCTWVKLLNLALPNSCFGIRVIHTRKHYFRQVQLLTLTWSESELASFCAEILRAVGPLRAVNSLTGVKPAPVAQNALSPIPNFAILAQAISQRVTLQAHRV